MPQIIHNNYVFDKNFLHKFNQACIDSNSYNYHKALNQKLENGFSVIDTVSALNRSVPINIDCPKNIPVEIPEEQQIPLILEFFNTLGLKDKVEAILLNKNPDYRVTISSKAKGSYVSHRGDNDWLDFSVQLGTTVESTSTIVHELSHALSQHHLKMLELVRKKLKAKTTYGENSQEYTVADHDVKEYSHLKERMDIDCVGEIESHIIEKLFMLFLIDKGIISEEYYQIFVDNLNKSLRNNLVLILEENDIFNQIQYPISMPEFENVHNTLKQNKHYNNLMHRMRFIAERKDMGRKDHHSSHMLRYVIAEVVSTLWIKKYLESSKEEQVEMIKEYVEYLNKTAALSLESAVPALLGEGKTIYTVYADYIDYITNQTITI